MRVLGLTVSSLQKTALSRCYFVDCENIITPKNKILKIGKNNFLIYLFFFEKGKTEPARYWVLSYILNDSHKKMTIAEHLQESVDKFDKHFRTKAGKENFGDVDRIVLVSKVVYNTHYYAPTFVSTFRLVSDRWIETQNNV